MSQFVKSDLVLQLQQNEEWQKAQRGELYVAFVPELIAARDRCTAACDKFNTMTDRTRRNMVQAWREISGNAAPLPTPAPTAAEDDELFQNEPWVCAPLRADYGVNIIIEPGAFVNFGSTFVDTTPITIGARTLVGPNCSFFSGKHPIDPAIRRGLQGPEDGKPITIGEDCWLGGNVTVLPGVTIGRGSTVGAGSVVTKSVPPFHVVAGNPARILRKIETSMDTDSNNPPPSTAATASNPNPDSDATVPPGITGTIASSK